MYDRFRLTTRAMNCLKREGIENLGTLVMWSASELSEIPCLGDGTLFEIESKLLSHGLWLRPETEQRDKYLPTIGTKQEQIPITRKGRLALVEPNGL